MGYAFQRVTKSVWWQGVGLEMHHKRAQLHVQVAGQVRCASSIAVWQELVSLPAKGSALMQSLAHPHHPHNRGHFPHGVTMMLEAFGGSPLEVQGQEEERLHLLLRRPKKPSNNQLYCLPPHGAVYASFLNPRQRQ